MTLPDDEFFMKAALEAAAEAESQGEVPVGAVVVRGGEIISRGYNLRETAQDPTAHAELIACRKAAAYLGSWRLDDCDVYVTLEPCPMCAGMLVNARINRVVWGADDAKAGATKSLYALGSDERLNHRYELKSGVLEDECAGILQRFFLNLRQKRKKR